MGRAFRDASVALEATERAAVQRRRQLGRLYAALVILSGLVVTMCGVAFHWRQQLAAGDALLNMSLFLLISGFVTAVLPLFLSNLRRTYNMHPVGRSVRDVAVLLLLVASMAQIPALVALFFHIWVTGSLRTIIIAVLIVYNASIVLNLVWSRVLSRPHRPSVRHRNFSLNILDIFAVSTPKGDAGFQRDWQLIDGDFGYPSSSDDDAPWPTA